MDISPINIEKLHKYYDTISHKSIKYTKTLCSLIKLLKKQKLEIIGSGTFNYMSDKKRNKVVNKLEKSKKRNVQLIGKMENIIRKCNIISYQSQKNINRLNEENILINDSLINYDISIYKNIFAERNNELNKLNRNDETYIFKRKAINDECIRKFCTYQNISKETLKAITNILSLSEQLYIIEATTKKFKEIIFDTENTNWYTNATLIHNLKKNKKYLFIIITHSLDKFAIFIDKISNKITDQYWHSTTKQSCIITLKKHGKKTKEKFNIITSKYGVYLNTNDEEVLLKFGAGSSGAIVIRTKTTQKRCYVIHTKRSFEYNESLAPIIQTNENPKSKQFFNLKRMVVIEMI